MIFNSDALQEAARVVENYDNKNDTWGAGLLFGKAQQLRTLATQLTKEDEVI